MILRRRQILIGTALLAAGAGILFSLLLGSAFLSVLFAAGLIVGGALLLTGSS